MIRKFPLGSREPQPKWLRQNGSHRIPVHQPLVDSALLAATEQQIGKRVECVAIDEGQFVQDLFLFTKRLLESGYDVMVAGLELDFRGMPFGEMMDLAWLVRLYAGNITELVSYCSCGAKAIYPQRLIDGKPAHWESPIIMAGDNASRMRELIFLPGNRLAPTSYWSLERARLRLEGTGFSPYINNPIKTRALAAEGRLFRKLV